MYISLKFVKDNEVSILDTQNTFYLTSIDIYFVKIDTWYLEIILFKMYLEIILFKIYLYLQERYRYLEPKTLVKTILLQKYQYLSLRY